jgi:uncharacterized protein YecE (DUF72 family)
MEYFLGCSGWYYNDWAEKFYPEDLAKKKWLQFYSEHFNTVEINNTFYRFPTEKQLENWCNKTPSNFVFTLKANRLITHRKRFQNTKDLVDRFYALADILKEKLGCILFQLPPMLHKDLELLERITVQLGLRRNNIIEFRHESWFDEEVYRILRKHSIGFCSVSAPDLPQDLVATSRNAYVRFHGTSEKMYTHLYSKEEMIEWAERIRKLKVDKVFCYFNNDYQANAVTNCMQLKELLRIK